MLSFLEKNKNKRALYFHEGCVDFYNNKIKVIELRIEKGKSGGADQPGHKFYDLFQSLSAELKSLITSRDQELEKVKNLETEI